jgi:hypothetical protein
MASLLGLKFNYIKTGSVYLSDKPRNPEIVKALPVGPVTIGFLQLDEATGKWNIDRDKVNSHVTQLGKQLSECTSVLTWIQTWNSCIGRFFENTFGEPAACFGREHIDDILQIYQEMQQTLFRNSTGDQVNLVTHVKRMLQSRFAIDNVPDAFLFLPEQVGGLGIKNPFIRLLLVRNNVQKTPEELLQDFLVEEREEYERKKEAFLNEREKTRIQRYERIYGKIDINDSHVKANAARTIRNYMSFEESIARRDITSQSLVSLYKDMTTKPDEERIKVSKDVSKFLQYTRSKDDHQTEWILQLNREDMLEKARGFTLVPSTMLPLGILKMMRTKRVTWRMVL